LIPGFYTDLVPGFYAHLIPGFYTDPGSQFLRSLIPGFYTDLLVWFSFYKLERLPGPAGKPGQATRGWWCRPSDAIEVSTPPLAGKMLLQRLG